MLNECIAVSWLSQWGYFFGSLYFLWDQWERHLRMRSTTWIINTHSWAETDKGKTYWRRENIGIETKRLSWNWKESNLLWEDVWRLKYMNKGRLKTWGLLPTPLTLIRVIKVSCPAHRNRSINADITLLRKHLFWWCYSIKNSIY